MKRRTTTFALGLAAALPFLLAAKCKKKPKRVDALCSSGVSTDDESTTIPLPVWLAFISPTVDRDTMTREGPLRDACGRVVKDVSADENFVCENTIIEYAPIPGDPVEEDDLIMSQVGEGRVLLWAATDELANGETSGVAALALWTEGGIEIHAAGALRGYREGARLRLAFSGLTPVVILESDRCSTDEPEGRCTRIAHFIPIINKRIQELPYYETDKGCLGRAQFVLSKQTEVKLDNGWMRRFEMTRSVELEDGAILLTDLVAVVDYDPRTPENPPTPFRRVVSRRPLEVYEDRLEIRDENLWDKVLHDHGQVQVEKQERPQESPDDPDDVEDE